MVYNVFLVGEVLTKIINNRQMRCLAIRLKRAVKAFCQPIGIKSVCDGTNCNLQYKRMTFYCDKCHHFTD